MLNIISLGAGVQSSTMALMAAHGEITPMPDCAIFADTGAEPQNVYTHLDALEKALTFPVYRVSTGDLTETSTRIRVSKKTGLPYLSHFVPAYTVNEDGSKGTYFRQCTDKHKLTPLRRKIDELRSGETATVWIGISVDEAHRMKPSGKDYIIHRWPLVDANISRTDCLKWMESKGYPKPPRSACVFCPYHSDTEWRRLKDEEPREFELAVLYEQLLQTSVIQIPRLTGKPFLHPSRIPLDQVEFRQDAEVKQLSLFGNECEGMCGV